jgi:hypothetical protein
MKNYFPLGDEWSYLNVTAGWTQCKWCGYGNSGGSYEYPNEHSDSIKVGEFLGQYRNCSLTEKGPASWTSIACTYDVTPKWIWVCMSVKAKLPGRISCTWNSQRLLLLRNFMPNNKNDKPSLICSTEPTKLWSDNLVKILSSIRNTRWRSGWVNVLQTGRSRVRFPMVSLDFFIYIILLVALRP